MKCLLFIISLFLGRCIDAQGIYKGYSSLENPVDLVSLEMTKANLPEEPQKSGDDTYDNKGGELPSEAETEENPPEESEQRAYDDKNSYITMTSDENTSEAESSEEERRKKNKLTDDLNPTDNSNNENKLNEETMKRFQIEQEAGEKSDLIGQNQHIVQSHYYNDLGRRSVAQVLKNIAAENDDYLTPEKAPPELVLLVAKESALLRAGKEADLGSDFDRKNILRTGDYWNGVWKEKVNPKSAMRSSSQKKKLIELLRYEVAPEFRFIHYPSMSYYAERRNEIRAARPQRTTRVPMKRRRL